MSDSTSSWSDTIAGFAARLGGRGGLIISFPEYRPDLAKAVANRLSLDFFDYRADEMSQHGAEAGKIPLQSLDASLQSRASQRGILAFNVEALLATKDEETRKRWIEQFVHTDWPNLIVLPIAIFNDDALESSERLIILNADELPEQGVISRLLH